MKFKESFLKILKILGLMFVLQFPSLRVLYKYTAASQHFLIYFYLLLIFAVYWIIFSKQILSLLNNILNKRWITWVLAVVIILINFIVYPIADNLKLQGKGSDQDDAIIVTASNLALGKNPYEAHTYFTGNPLSPGPGWIILNLPFALKGLYFLLTPFYIILLLLLLRKITGGYFSGNLFIILCISSFAFWETMVVGSDMFAIGALFTLSICAIFYNVNKRKVLLALSMLLFAFAATSRIIFIYILPIMGIFLWRRTAFKYLVYLLVASAVTVLLHLIFYFWNPAVYTPLHLLAKGDRLLISGFKDYAVILTLAVLVFTYLKVNSDISSWIFFFALSLGVPLFFVSIGDLVNMRHFNFALWEGANYLLVIMPIYLAYITLSQKEF